MKQIVYKDYNELSLNSALMLADIIAKKPDALLCFPAGETSLGTFRELLEIKRKKNLSFKKCRIVGLDEWLGLGEMKDENCFSFLKKNLFNELDITEKNICFFDGESPDPLKECQKTEDFLKNNGPIDMILLGAGMNGHLGLNEPGNPFSSGAHIVELDITTRLVGQKYFTRPVNLKRGITLGIKNIMESRKVILQVTGENKAEIARRLVYEEISPEFPVSVLKSHANSCLLLDSKAAEKL